MLCGSSKTSVPSPLMVCLFYDILRIFLWGSMVKCLQKVGVLVMFYPNETI